MYGTYKEGDRLYDMAFSVRTPEMVRKRISDEAVEVVFVSSGASGEIRTTPTKGGQVTRAMREDDLYWYVLVLEGAMFRLAGSESENFSYGFSPAETKDGFQRILSVGPSGVPLTHLIDEDSWLEVERSLEVRINGRPHILTLVLEDHRAVDDGKAMLAHRLRFKVNGSERGLILIDSIRLNPGLAPWMFTFKRDEG